MTEVEEPHNLAAITGCLEAATYSGQTFVEHAGRIGTARRRMRAEMSESGIIMDHGQSRAFCLARWESLRTSMCVDIYPSIFFLRRISR